MKRVRLVCAVLLALPLLIFGGNYFLELFEVQEPAASAGLELLQSMRDGGLMSAIALSHVVIAVLLLMPSLRFVAALLQLPMSIGILAFHVTMMPEGIGPAVMMMVMNLGVLADGARLRGAMGTAD